MMSDIPQVRSIRLTRRLGAVAILEYTPDPVPPRRLATPRSPTALFGFALTLAVVGAVVIVRAFLEARTMTTEGARAEYLARIIELSILFAASLSLAGIAGWLVARLADSRRQLQELAIRDSLTGLYNRRHFREMYAQEVARAKRTGTGFSVAMLDVDEFKQINDTLGHTIGDELLAAFAELLRTTTRSVDLVARYGGDEFVILMPATTSVNARAAVERFEHSLTRWRHEYAPHGLRVSIGISTWNGKTEVLEEADREMYRAKQQREPVPLAR